MAKDGAIGPNGRSVSCARCDAVWFVQDADPDALALEDNKTVLITPESDPEIDLQPELPLETDTAGAGAGAVSGTGVGAVGAHVLLRNKTDAEKLAKRKRLIGLIWAVPLAGLIGLAALGLVKRQDIVERQPKAATLYSGLGMTVKANGLDINGLSSERLVIDGTEVLRVTGEVVNLTSQAKTSPLVQIRLENRSGEALTDWFVEPGTIPAKKSVKIETDYPAPPIDSVELRYRFAPEDER
jgi:hypothetical protein